MSICLDARALKPVESHNKLKRNFEDRAGGRGLLRAATACQCAIMIRPFPYPRCRARLHTRPLGRGVVRPSYRGGAPVPPLQSKELSCVPVPGFLDKRVPTTPCKPKWKGQKEQENRSAMSTMMAITNTSSSQRLQPQQHLRSQRLMGAGFTVGRQWRPSDYSLCRRVSSVCSSGLCE